MSALPSVKSGASFAVPVSEVIPGGRGWVAEVVRMLEDQKIRRNNVTCCAAHSEAKVKPANSQTFSERETEISGTRTKRRKHLQLFPELETGQATTKVESAKNTASESTKTKSPLSTKSSKTKRKSPELISPARTDSSSKVLEPFKDVQPESLRALKYTGHESESLCALKCTGHKPDSKELLHQTRSDSAIARKWYQKLYSGKQAISKDLESSKLERLIFENTAERRCLEQHSSPDMRSPKTQDYGLIAERTSKSSKSKLDPPNMVTTPRSDYSSPKKWLKKLYAEKSLQSPDKEGKTAKNKRSQLKFKNVEHEEDRHKNPQLFYPDLPSLDKEYSKILYDNPRLLTTNQNEQQSTSGSSEDKAQKTSSIKLSSPPNSSSPKKWFQKWHREKLLESPAKASKSPKKKQLECEKVLVEKSEEGRFKTQHWSYQDLLYPHKHRSRSGSNYHILEKLGNAQQQHAADSSKVKAPKTKETKNKSSKLPSPVRPDSWSPKKWYQKWYEELDSPGKVTKPSKKRKHAELEDTLEEQHPSHQQPQPHISKLNFQDSRGKLRNDVTSSPETSSPKARNRKTKREPSYFGTGFLSLLYSKTKSLLNLGSSPPKSLAGLPTEKIKVKFPPRDVFEDDFTRRPVASPKALVKEPIAEKESKTATTDIKEGKGHYIFWPSVGYGSENNNDDRVNKTARFEASGVPAVTEKADRSDELPDAWK